MAMIVDAFAGKLLERLTNIIDEKAMLLLGVKDELQTLRRRMERISLVLKDAERKKIQDETVKGWVNELKDFMYDADDIIDLCMIQGDALLQQNDGDHHHHSPPAESSRTASTRRMKITDQKNNGLPKWLISFLQQRKKPHDDQFHLHISCSAQALKGCLKGRPCWDFLEQVPRLYVYTDGGSMYLKYTKEPYSYQTKLVEDIN